MFLWSTADLLAREAEAVFLVFLAALSLAFKNEVEARGWQMMRGKEREEGQQLKRKCNKKWYWMRIQA